MSACMDHQSLMSILSGAGGGLWPSALRAALAAVAVPYARVMHLRRWAYRSGLRKSHAAGLPVICVGNMTTGGTGKTPMVAWVVWRLKDAGATPAILTRGYKATAGKSDEAELLNRLCNVEVVTNADRLAGARYAAAGADVLVMDDGFQHRRLRRDLDIVLVDASRPLGFGHCLPRGLLREPLTALKDAHAIVITRSDHVEETELSSLRARIARLAPAVAVHLAVHRPTKLIDPAGEHVPLEALRGKRAFAFCGLGNPEAFFMTVRRLGADLAGCCALADHVRYDPAAAEALSGQARSAGAEVMVTTQKDAVKIDSEGFSLPLWQVAVEMDVVQGAEELTDRIRTLAPRS